MSVLLFLLLVVATLFAGWRAWRRLRFFLHVYQLETYHLNEYSRWVARRAWPLAVARSHLIGALLLGGAVLLLPSGPVRIVAAVLLFAWIVTFASSGAYRSEREKKPLAFTSRMKRMLGVAAVLALAPVAGGVALGLTADGWTGVVPYLLGWGLADLGAPFWVWVAAALLMPVEQSFQNGFKREAWRRLGTMRDLTVVGVTGSYGKTSVKFIVAELLRQRYNVLATPGSYNTPMGICIVVNNKLRPEHQVLVLEMGARYTGDIRELCELAPPDIGIVTSVGVAHLETMGPIDNIARVKGELVRHMKPGGPVVLNADDHRVAAMADDARGKVWRVSVEGNPADITAHDIRYGPEGTSFVVRDETGAEETFGIRLLGAHNVLNVLLAVAVGRELGLRLRQMAHAARRLEPVEHRLQLRQDGPVTVIDDAFNANPVGARNAVEILGQFDSGRRVIVTPGMVELGERQAEENRTFGTHIAHHVDLAVLIGPEQTRPIREGLQAEGFPDEQIEVFTTFFEAQEFLKRYLREGDVVLYENDLPDQYTEAA